jgi:hypothetical protein
MKNIDSTTNVEELKAFVADNPGFVSGDDDQSTDAGLRETAMMVRDRMADEAESISSEEQSTGPKKVKDELNLRRLAIR